jgi:hypothetical protein
MFGIVAVLATITGLSATAAPAIATTQTTTPIEQCAPDLTGTVHIKLANCEPTGAPVVDFGRGIRITAAGAVELRTTHLANLRLTHYTDPTPGNGVDSLGTFRIKYGTKFLRVNKTGAYLGSTPMLFGIYPGPGWNGPRPIWRAQSDSGPPLASKLVLTASGTVLKLTPISDPTGIQPPNPHQIWTIYNP